MNAVSDLNGRVLKLENAQKNVDNVINQKIANITEQVSIFDARIESISANASQIYGSNQNEISTLKMQISEVNNQMISKDNQIQKLEEELNLIKEESKKKDEKIETFV